MTLSNSSLGTGPMSFISKLNHILSTMDHSCHIAAILKLPFVSRSVKICQRILAGHLLCLKKSTNITHATMFTYLTNHTACIECISSPYLRRRQNSAVDPDISMALRSRPFGFGVAEDGSSESLRAGKLGNSATFFGWSTLIHDDSCFQDTERGLVDGEKGAFSLRDFHDFEHSHSKSATASTSLSCSIPKVSSQIGSYSGYSGSSHQALGDFNQKSIRRNQRPKKGPLL